MIVVIQTLCFVAFGCVQKSFEILIQFYQLFVNFKMVILIPCTIPSLLRNRLLRPHTLSVEFLCANFDKYQLQMLLVLNNFEHEIPEGKDICKYIQISIVHFLNFLYMYSYYVKELGSGIIAS